MFKVVGGVQNYAWGKIGTESCVSLFSNIVDNNTPLAEYWLGTHKSLPSKLENSILSDEIGDLPYLFKLLSIAKPLSIQIHPSKSQAEYLHSLNPALYPDNNYKPEMCIAKSKMRLFLGFRPIQEINLLLNSTPELHTIVDEKTDLKMQLMSLYSDESKTRYLVREYCTRVNSGIYCELNSFYPEDPGVFFAMFMNYVELNPGEAVVIHAGVPHCYIDGECFEAMACSDNVVRAGLTPKPKDVKTLLEVRQN